MATWLWQKNVSRDQEELWQERLGALPGLVISEAAGRGRAAVSVYTEESSEALVLQACYGGSVTPVNDTDWVAATAPQNQPPLLIRDQLVITTSERPEDLAALREKYPRRHILCFPAEMAFGTGNHATTASCLRMLCDFAREHRGRAWTLTDIGCGTGVLALAGLRLGAQSAISFDFDAQAVAIAERNIARNGGCDHLKLFQADVFEWTPSAEDRADLVLANLFSTVLQKAFPRIIRGMKDGGTLIISGMLNSQAEETIAAPCAAGLSLQQSVRRGKWTTPRLTLP